ncbi:PREDICTED: protein MALE DISCOVERER 2-like isoform X2 [Ipomoea nil]|uniref:protein MALE DISCOVERER 2-like isoform X2 n=1 Tax=Ipomoea nil TaxID=35883 RepID=UPI0009018B25|nr:PREDICTED: protein MALE DISCOVERER 2-like isoform X2 [Ipomoea nil]
MVWKAMGVRLTAHGGIQFLYHALLILALHIHGCCSLNSEGLALLKFQERVVYDPYGVFLNWNSDDCDPCLWTGVRCFDGKVEMLDLSGYDLKGTLAPELGNLPHLKSLVLSRNHFSGVVPQEIGQLEMLEVLDLRDNSLNGRIPAQIGGLHLLRSLLLCNNGFEGNVPLEIGKLELLTDLQYDTNLISTTDLQFDTNVISTGTGFIHRKLGRCICRSSGRPLKKMGFYLAPIKGILIRYLNLVSIFNFGKGFLHGNCSYCFEDQSTSSRLHAITRRKLAEQANNLAAAPANGGAQLGKISPQPFSRSSGSFPAVPGTKPKPPQSPPPSRDPKQHSKPNSKKPDNQDSGFPWKYIVAILCGVLLLIIALVIICICRSRAARNIGPWKTGLSGQLQKAFVTGVPKLNRPELEAACEDFSNIIRTNEVNTSYKGTLSSGVEIAVVSTSLAALNDWSKRSELTFRKKIDTLSRINHKNFLNLIGYCAEEEPFTRMMVFEYAPNGTLSEHLQDQELEHLDWSARMRIVMGVAYCLQYMHNLNPPLSHSNMTSDNIFLTDDYASKIGEITFWDEFTDKTKLGENEDSELPPLPEPETNIYSFGLMLLEIISGKLTYTEEQGPILNWATPFLNDKQNINKLIDPTLKSYKDNELAVICEVIQECVQQDTRTRPTINEVISKLREVLGISPEAAVPRLSPLWWAELEILSAEAL